MNNSIGASIAKLLIIFNDEEEKPNNGNNNSLNLSKTAFLLFFCILGAMIFGTLLYKMSNIEHQDDFITITREHGEDPMLADIQLINDYYSLNTDNKQEAELKAIVGFHLIHERQSCINKEKNTQMLMDDIARGGLPLDTVYDQGRIDIRRNINFYVNNLLTVLLWWDRQELVKSDYEVVTSLDTVPLFKARSKTNYMYTSDVFYAGENEGEEVVYHYGLPYRYQPKVEGPNWLALEDISQRYYDLKLNVKTAEGISINEEDSIVLAIDFGGATEFVDMPIEPDERTIRSIKYTDQEKIDAITRNGLRLFCKFPEMSNKQELRLFLVTTIMTILITQALIYIYRIIKKLASYKFRNILIWPGIIALINIWLYFAFYEYMSGYVFGVIVIVSSFLAVFFIRTINRKYKK